MDEKTIKLKAQEHKEKSEKRKYLLISILSVMTFFLVWELVTDVLHLMPDYTLPSPMRVLSSFIKKMTTKAPDGDILPVHILTSLKVSLFGFFLGSMTGVPIGIMMAWHPRFENFFRPLFDMIRPIPTVAWIPIMILWFGIGLGAKAAVIFVSAFIPCVVNSFAGIKQTSQVHLWVAQTFGASRREMLFKVAIPTALPSIFTGLRLSLGSSWMALVAAEMLAANKGLGYMIYTSRSLGRADLIIVGMMTIGIIGAFFSFVLGSVEKKIVKGVSR